MSTTDIIIRFAVAIVLSGAIGWERESAGRPAGLKTHVLVGFSSCLVMLCGSYLAIGSSVDPTRMAAQVVSGIGFLGAGTIMHEGATIKGLTTAATLWAVGCIGIAAGAGFYIGASIAGIVALISLVGFEKIEVRLGNKSEQRIGITLEYSGDTAINGKIQEVAKEFNLDVKNITMSSMENGKYMIRFDLISLPRRPKISNFDFLASRMTSIPTVQNYSIREKSI